MRINQVRKILDEQAADVSSAIAVHTEKGLSYAEICVADPFLAGRATMLSDIALKWYIVDDKKEEV
jgi:hypothetical protein